MKLRQIFRADADAATDLLSEGFPVHARKTWQESVHRLLAHAERGWDGSIGCIASQGDIDIGIGLAIPGMRSAYEPEARKVVNLAAFYMRPGHEWMTTLFLRRMMKDSSVEYVDVTASIAMREVNRKLGFIDKTHGSVVTPTGLTALRPGFGVRIVAFDQAPRGALSADHLKLLEHHARLQAMSLAVELDGAWHPLILVKNHRKRLTGARVILARDVDLVRRVAGPLCRHLMAHGILFLEFDSVGPVGMLGSAFVGIAAPAQSTRQDTSGVIDHTFTELMFIPPPNNRPILPWTRGRGNSAMPFPFGLIDASIATAPATGMVLNMAEMLSA